MSYQEQIFINVPLERLEPIFKRWIKEVITEIKTTDYELLSRAQVAEILGISLPTLDEYTRNGLIQALRIGTRIRYKKPDVYNALSDLDNVKYIRNKQSKYTRK